MNRILLVVVSLCGIAVGQPWSGILATSRAIRWDQNAGLPTVFIDGETTANAWNQPIRSTICTTLSAGATSAAMNSAFTTCSSPTTPSVISLPAGTSTLAGDINFYGKNITLRGAGPMSTFINLNGHNLTLGRHSSAGSTAVTAGLSQGSTSITVASSSGITSGMIVQMYQCDDPNSGNPCSLTTPTDNGSIWVCGFNSVCNIDGGAGVYRDQQQTFLVTNVAGNVLTVSPGIYMSNWATAFTATVEWNDFASFPCTGIGLENVTIVTPHSGGTINFSYCYASWITGVRFIGSNTDGGNSIVEGEGNMRTLMANNYLYCLDPTSPNVSNYMFLEPQRESDNLFLNNILNDCAFRPLGHLEGDVLAYNYLRDALSNTAAGFEENCVFQHYPGVAFVLNEGNQMGCDRDDATWGTHDLDTRFREYLECYDVPFFNTGSTSVGMDIGVYSRFDNSIGNVIGSKTTAGTNTGCLSYQSTGNTAAYVIPDGGADALTTGSFMRWGNVTTILQASDTPANSGIRFVSSEVPSSLSAPNAALSNPVPGNNTLPASFFMSATAHPFGGTGLSWWKVCTAWSSFPTCTATQTQPFPTAGPDVTGGSYVSGTAYDIPAAVAWKALPVDTAYQNSYTVTGSSYSGTTETLTVTIPAGWHIQGGFTPPAWNAACNPVGGLSFTGRSDGEILMTGSSSTTIQYELASNPGLSCTGTLKWPNVRKFDPSIFQADSGAVTPQTSAPVGSIFALVQF